MNKYDILGSNKIFQKWNNFGYLIYLFLKMKNADKYRISMFLKQVPLYETFKWLSSFSWFGSDW